MEIQNISNDKIIIFFLGVALILLIIFKEPEYYGMILAGLLGALGLNRYNQSKLENTIQTSIQENLNGEGSDETNNKHRTS